MRAGSPIQIPAPAKLRAPQHDRRARVHGVPDALAREIAEMVSTTFRAHPTTRMADPEDGLEPTRRRWAVADARFWAKVRAGTSELLKAFAVPVTREQEIRDSLAVVLVDMRERSLDWTRAQIRLEAERVVARVLRGR
jgi:hypothetical protein